MDGDHFDAWTRRRLGLATGSSIAALLGALALRETGAKKKKRKRKKRCKKPCGSCQTCKKGRCKRKPAGSACAIIGECLLNRTCARRCTNSLDCLSGCVCSTPANAEGDRYCVVEDFGGGTLPECGSTADCPTGSHCQSFGCPACQRRCVPLCKE